MTERDAPAPGDGRPPVGRASGEPTTAESTGETGEPVGRTSAQALAVDAAPPLEDGAEVGSAHETSDLVEVPALGPEREASSAICPLFRSAAAHGSLAAPLATPDPVNRCAAGATPIPLDLLQQELVCATDRHVTCPRYVHASVGTRAAAARPTAARPEPARPEAARPAGARPVGAIAVRRAGAMAAARSIDRPTLAVRLAAAAVVVAVVLVGAFGFINGGLFPGASPTPTLAALVSPTAVASPSDTPIVTPSPEPTATPTAVPSPTPTPPSTPTTTPPPSPAGIAARWAGLEKCTAPATCYYYVVHRGDNLYSIAGYFATTLDVLKALNPKYKTSSTIHAGDVLKIPPPPK